MAIGVDPSSEELERVGLGLEQWQEVKWKMFRFQTWYLEHISDGGYHVLKADEDYPRSMPFKVLRNRLYQHARYRMMEVRVFRLAEDAVSVEFVPRRPS